jgi:beta-lactamase class A
MSEGGIPEELARVVEECPGELCLAAADLSTGRTIELNADRKCATASVIKLPILVHVLLLAEEGVFSLEETVALTNEEKVPGSGILTHLSAGLVLPIRDLCILMTALSDNTATNMLLERVGIAPVNARMRDLGLRETTVFRKAYSPDNPVSPENARYGFGVTTPREMLRLLTELYAGRTGTPETSAAMRAILAKQQHRDGIPRLLPAGCLFEGKSGAVDLVRNDVGLVTLPDGRTFALALFCNGLPAPLWTADNPGTLAIARAARAIIDHYSA